ncbi:hypothetical protein WDW37_00500 [Bdellovibrionota bacterium FG-1]
MNADLIYYRRVTKLTTDGREIDIRMDLFQIPATDADKYPGSVKFSWIAFERENPERYVLFDSHPPKGPHSHTPSGDEILLSWTNVGEMEDRFFKAIETHFGSLKG